RAADGSPAASARSATPPRRASAASPTARSRAARRISWGWHAASCASPPRPHVPSPTRCARCGASSGRCSRDRTRAPCRAARGLRVVDAVCPLVSKVHAEARRYADSGHLVALVGHKHHVEVIGTMGERPESTVVVESPEEARALETGGRPVAVITQTTLSLDDVAPIVGALGERVGSTLKRPAADDICYATQNRQDAVKRLAAEATLILVIGSAP